MPLTQTALIKFGLLCLSVYKKHLQLPMSTRQSSSEAGWTSLSTVRPGKSTLITCSRHCYDSWPYREATEMLLGLVQCVYLWYIVSGWTVKPEINNFFLTPLKGFSRIWGSNGSLSRTLTVLQLQPPWPHSQDCTKSSRMDINLWKCFTNPEAADVFTTSSGLQKSLS